MKKYLSLIIITITTFGCNDPERNASHNDKDLAVNNEIETTMTHTKGQITTFFTFQENNAEEAMNFYVSLFNNSKITHVQRHGKDGPGKEGSIFWATFVLNGSQFACSDSPIKHAWTFTPGVSNFVECTSNEEIEMLFAKLSENGQVMMPLDNYGWSKKFAFVEDRFGICWQLNLN